MSHDSVSNGPLIGPNRRLAEITVKGLILGLLLSMLLAAANAYIGLLVGLTVSASIPAAAVSLGVLRLFRRSNILENNMVQTSASAGESLVAGIIFTIPALVLMQAWQGYEYWPMVSIAIVGGILGVAFTVPLRRALIVEAKLKYPEGIATAEVLKSGGIERDRTKSVEGDVQSAADKHAADGFKLLLQATGIGALFNLCQSGFGLMTSSVAATRAWFEGCYLFTGNISLNPALLGVGYIVGLNIAILVFMGGVIGTIIGVPLNWIINSDVIMARVGIDAATPLAQLSSDQWAALASESWNNCRRIGVGAMIIGGVWSLISLFKPLVAGVKASLHAYRATLQDGHESVRTELDTPFNYVLIVVALMAIPTFFIFHHALGAYPDKLFISILMTIMMLIFGFLFSSVAAYMAGLVGSSNNPISGVTIATVIISALILFQLMGNEGMAGILGPIAVIFLAGMICSSAAIGGDNMQDLKCGHLVGSTPWRQQLYQLIGVIGAAFVIPFVLQVLDNGYGIGRPSPLYPDAIPLSAPQAGLMRDLASGIFGSGIQWGYIFLGFALAVILIVADEILRKRGSHFRTPVLAVAIGIYLPLGLSLPIFMGGLLVHFVNKKTRQLKPEQHKTVERQGLLVASGLITGVALMGVLIAIIAAFVMPLPSSIGIAWLLGIIAFIAVMYYLYRRPMIRA